MGTYFGGFVFGRGDEISAIRGELKISDRHAFFVSSKAIEEFTGLRVMLSRCFRAKGIDCTYLGIILGYGSVFVPGNDIL